MRLMRVVFALTIVCGLVLSAGLVPQSVLAVDATVSGTNCNRAGLETAISIAKGDPGGKVTFDCADPTIEFTSEIVIDASVTIDGSNGDGPTMILDGIAGDNMDTRIFNISTAGVDVKLENLTLQNASMVDFELGWQFWKYGGAIYNAGNLELSMVTLKDNAADRGGAIANGEYSVTSGSLTVTQSSFVGNTTGTLGGAIFTSGDMSISQSSFVGNSASTGGALYLHEGDGSNPPQIQVTSSTFSENTATQGAFDVHVNPVLAGGSVLIDWSTFVQPSVAGFPSLVVVNGPGVTLSGLIFGGGGIAHCSYPNGAPSISHLLSNDSTCDGDTAVDRAWENADLLLGDLTTQVVNGVTQSYYPLLEGSPAINTGGTDCSTPDQLGTTRPVGSQCDIGAFESLGNSPDITTIDAPATADEGDDVTVSVTATDTDSDTLHYWIDCENDSTWELTDSTTTTSTTCNYQGNGDFTIKVQVSDGASTVSETKAISISNVDPEITSFTATPTTGQLNEAITLDVEATDVSVDLPLMEVYTCDEFTEMINSCTFSTGGWHTVGVNVHDGDGGFDSVTKNIFVNTPPTNPQIDVSTPALEGPGGTTVTITATDPDGDTLHYWIDCENDDTWELTDSTENSVDCNYPNQGVYVVAAMVSDGGASASGGLSIGVLNAAPVITGFVANPNPALIGQQVVLSTTWTDVSADVPNVTVTYDCGDGEQLAADTCSFASFGSHEVSVTVNDQEGGVAIQSLDVQVLEPISLCVDQWTGQIREASGDDCGSSDNLIQLPEDAPLQLCVNQWNGQAEVSNDCGRSEYVVMVYGTNDVSVCVNRWNGTMRVSESCTRSESQEWL